MPIYEYVCQNCGHHLEILQKMSDAPMTKCTECSKGKLEKVFSQTSFQLKGSGWYVTDYGKTGGSKAAKSTPDKGEKKDTATSATTGSTNSTGKSDK